MSMTAEDLNGAPQPADETVDVAPAPVVVPVVEDDEPHPTTHLILPEDTLDSIAAKYNMDTSELWQYNGGQLDREAAARGLGHSENGRILFPGHVVDLQPSQQQGQYSPVNSSPSAATELAKIHQLHTVGAIDDNEYAVAKKALLAKIK